MKLICPANEWRSAIEINPERLGLIEHIANGLGLRMTHDAINGKLYLALPEGCEPATAVDDTLRFTMRLPKHKAGTIIDGVITLRGQMYKATSGCVGGQVYGSYWVTAQSPIPPGSGYKIDLRWNYSDLTGIAGRFYHILPDPIIEPETHARRTEIGLHQDNGVPGTSGCIGVVGRDWGRLCNVLDEMAKFNRYAKLEVEYLCQD